MEFKEHPCDECKWRWEMSKDHCNRCVHNVDNLSTKRSDQKDNFKEVENG